MGRVTTIDDQEPHRFLSPSEVVSTVKRWSRLRTVRNDIFARSDIFGEPAWDILLDLYLSRARGCKISVSSACIASNVPATTGLRWLTHLEKEGWIVRTEDGQDRRRAFVEITDEAVSNIEKLAHRFGR